MVHGSKTHCFSNCEYDEPSAGDIVAETGWEFLVVGFLGPASRFRGGYDPSGEPAACCISLFILKITGKVG